MNTNNEFLQDVKAAPAADIQHMSTLRDEMAVVDFLAFRKRAGGPMRDLLELVQSKGSDFKLIPTGELLQYYMVFSKLQHESNDLNIRLTLTYDEYKNAYEANRDHAFTSTFMSLRMEKIKEYMKFLRSVVFVAAHLQRVCCSDDMVC